MANLLNKILSGARQYTILDFGMLKFALLFVGILIGIYFGKFLSEYLCIIWTLAIICYGYIIYSTLRRAFFNKKNKSLFKFCSAIF